MEFDGPDRYTCGECGAELPLDETAAQRFRAQQSAEKCPACRRWLAWMEE